MEGATKSLAPKERIISTHQTSVVENAPLQETNPDHSEPLWMSAAPLSKIEEQEFGRLVKDEIIHYIAWGEVKNPDAFRAALWEFGDRGAAHYARQLSSLSQLDVLKRSEAEVAIDQIDVLGYLAATEHPISIDAIEHLATRRISEDQSAWYKDQVRANVTYEAFDYLAKLKPKRAIYHIQSLPKTERSPFIFYSALYLRSKARWSRRRSD